MILLPSSVKVYASTAPTSLRKSFEGLSNEVRSVLRSDPLSGHVFLFLNRRRNQVKMLVWTRGGFMIVHKLMDVNYFFRSAVGSGAGAVVYRGAQLFPSLSVDGASLASPSLRLRRPPHRTGQADFPHPAHREGVIPRGYVSLGWCALSRSCTRGDSPRRDPRPRTRSRYSTVSTQSPCACSSSQRIDVPCVRRGT